MPNPEPWYSYHFDCGDSSDGPIGMCLRVKARSKAEAVTAANKIIEAQGSKEIHTTARGCHLEYAEIYLSPNLTEAHIDDFEDCDPPEGYKEAAHA